MMFKLMVPITNIKWKEGKVFETIKPSQIGYRYKHTSIKVDISSNMRSPVTVACL